MEEIPEADAAEQAQEVLPSEEPVTLPTDDPEVPEADAVEQARSLPYDDEEDRH